MVEPITGCPRARHIARLHLHRCFSWPLPYAHESQKQRQLTGGILKALKIQRKCVPNFLDSFIAAFSPIIPI